MAIIYVYIPTIGSLSAFQQFYPICMLSTFYPKVLFDDLLVTLIQPWMILDILGVNMQKMTYLGLTIIVKTLKTNIFISDIEILLIQNVLICSYKI